MALRVADVERVAGRIERSTDGLTADRNAGYGRSAAGGDPRATAAQVVYGHGPIDARMNSVWVIGSSTSKPDSVVSGSSATGAPHSSRRALQVRASTTDKTPLSLLT